jgi:hypothetical protein
VIRVKDCCRLRGLVGRSSVHEIIEIIKTERVTAKIELVRDERIMLSITKE